MEEGSEVIHDLEEGLFLWKGFVAAVELLWNNCVLSRN